MPTTDILKLLACPRCDKALDGSDNSVYKCSACDVEYPSIGGIPWLFSVPEVALTEWQRRHHMATEKLALASQQLQHELNHKLNDKLNEEALNNLTRKRLELLNSAYQQNIQQLEKILTPLNIQKLSANYNTHLAFKTRLPADQGLNTYYPNIHRDWSWGDEENKNSLEQIKNALGDEKKLGKTLILGAGAARLAYDIEQHCDTELVVALDFNPLLLLTAKSLVEGNQIELFEYPISPKTLELSAVLRTLKVPGEKSKKLHFILADALRAPFLSGSFDTVITPWLIDVIPDRLKPFSSRINHLLNKQGRWINFGSLTFRNPEASHCYSVEETLQIIQQCGFSEPQMNTTKMPYMCSPASRHGRIEEVITLCMTKTGKTKKPDRYQALPDWLLKADQPVPFSDSFQTQAASTRIHAFLMSTIDGKRSIQEMASILEEKRLMPYSEALPALQAFLIKMYDESQSYSVF
jgi:uncharacterized protein YbaR (Trm112 family)